MVVCKTGAACSETAADYKRTGRACLFIGKRDKNRGADYLFIYFFYFFIEKIDLKV
jgi:hypothetical protein